MQKPLITIFKILILLVMAFILYFAGILIINTALDYRPVNMELPLSHSPALLPDTGKTDFSLISWNIGYGGLGKETDFFYDGGKMVKPTEELAEKYFKGILGTIKAFEGPDMILLQEVDLASGRSHYRNQYSEIAAELPPMHTVFAKNYDAFFVPLPLLNPMGKVVSGLAIFSRHSLSVAQMVAFPGNYAWPKKLFMPDRCFIIAGVDLLSGKKLYVINTHNSAFDDGSLRSEQLRILFGYMQDLYRQGNYVVAGGDWNINPPDFKGGYFASGDPAFRVMCETSIFGDHPGWQLAYDGNFPSNRDVTAAYTYGVTSTTIRDFFVCSPNINILKVSTLYDGFENSDHHPVFLNFSLN